MRTRLSSLRLLQDARFVPNLVRRSEINGDSKGGRNKADQVTVWMLVSGEVYSPSVTAVILLGDVWRFLERSAEPAVDDQVV